MDYVGGRIAESKEDRARAKRLALKKAPKFAPGGQSTQLVVGATPEDDRTVLKLADGLYREQKLKRVYYSGYVPISSDSRLLKVDRAPLVREHRLYQADWLLRFYDFQLDEVVTDDAPMLDEAVDPKTSYALRHPHLFPIDVNTADLEWLLRVPGIGHKSAHRIVAARRHGTLRWEHLRRIGVVLKRARYFITVPEHTPRLLDRDPGLVRLRLVGGKQQAKQQTQLGLFAA